MTQQTLSSREDMEQLVMRLIAALRGQARINAAGFDLGPCRAFYGEAATDLETFSRPLWGAAPLCAAGKLEADWILRGLEMGTDPGSPAFWGKLGEMDSRMVEMAAIAFALKVAPEQVWAPLPDKAKRNLVAWLSQINARGIGQNNWLYFRVLVNEALLSIGEPHDAEQVSKDLEAIEALYMGQGWYGDGMVGTLDYYNAFAFHFYGLLYAKWTETREPERAARFRERATEFAQTFIYWWDSNGSTIPFGRSLVYRFGMAAFWGAAAYTGLPVLKMGEIKGLWARHLRWWFEQSILDANGILNLGYAYPNQNIVEMYNAPGSPMWAFKAFLPLALPESHDFWQAKELPMPELDCKAVPLPDGKKVLGRDDSGHAWMLSAGHNMPWQGRAFYDKYSRFAYSSRFGFSVSVEQTNPNGMAPDSTLIVSLDGETWFGRGRTEGYRAGDDWVESIWSPWAGMKIKTRLTVTPEGHRRCHTIDSEYPFMAIEGGFAIPRPDEPIEWQAQNPVDDFSMKVEQGLAEARNGKWFSQIRECIEGCPREGEMMQPWASTHLLFPTTLIPVLKGDFGAGRHQLECEVRAETMT